MNKFLFPDISLASILFSHPNFPAQFRSLTSSLGATGAHKIVFLTKNLRPEWDIKGIDKVVYTPSPNSSEEIHPYLRSTHSAIYSGQAAFEECINLKQQGFNPDLIIAHSGWGQSWFLRDVFPEAKIVGFFEWFFEPLGFAFQHTINDPDVGAHTSYHDILSSRVSNLPILQDLVSVDIGVCPTHWQRNQFPSDFQSKLHVIHEGIDTNYFKPGNDSQSINQIFPQLNLSSDSLIVTYTSRALEPMRGFPSFMRALPNVLNSNPRIHIVIVADDSRVCYGFPRPDGLSYKEYIMQELKDVIDWSRVHFLPPQNYGNYLSILQSSDCHVYLTKPYVLSWSFLEALAVGIPVVASSTPPVQEIVGLDNSLCRQVDFWNPDSIADAIIETLINPVESTKLALRARAHICENYTIGIGLSSWKSLITNHLAF